ncbi:DUF1648 domain-containing protein [Streptomyces sp. WMMC500]|uniref:DUF1648 domain-containing protein n=1 Tax=Streptomyces sp. WMMC500 TaxID=3015154 RepID=UPI00248BEBEF|nr:DUF1648 domain-containing protein [Streptomyces sp. WMMC500]WBB61964.1 DUF1648 domain-containing protein [Streptomyces sp. WMMC500]
MATSTVTRQRRTWWMWLMPSLLLLGTMVVWGAVRYSQLPERVPGRIGLEGVDAWTDKSVWTVFLPVFVYAGATVVVLTCAVGAARVTPLDAVPEPQDQWGKAASVMNGRPATAASAQRLVSALLMMNAVLGTAFLPLCWVQWRTTQTADVQGWIWPVTLAVFLVSLVPLGVAWWRDAEARKEGARRPDQPGEPMR